MGGGDRTGRSRWVGAGRGTGWDPAEGQTGQGGEGAGLGMEEDGTRWGRERDGTGHGYLWLPQPVRWPAPPPQAEPWKSKRKS